MNNKFKITNVNLRKFEKIINTSLMVRNNLMLEFSEQFVRSCALNSSSSIMKLFTVEIEKISMTAEELTPKKEEIILATQITLDSTPDKNNNISGLFDFYLLRGEILKNNFGIFDQNKPVDIEFDVIQAEDESRPRATSMKITGLSKYNTRLETTLPLTKDSLNTETISDYSMAMQHVTPDDNSHKISISPAMFEEVTSMIKSLHKTNVNNTIYIEIEVSGNQIIFKDKAFKIQYTIPESIEGSIEFKLAKNDWIKLTGENTVNIFLNKNVDDKKVIFVTSYIDSVIFSLITKVRGGEIVSADDTDK